MIANAPFVNKYNVAGVWVFSKHEAEASPWTAAEPQFKMRVWAIFWWLCWLPIVTAG